MRRSCSSDALLSFSVPLLSLCSLFACFCAQVVFTVDKACQLLGVGLCGTEGSFTVELEVFEVSGCKFVCVCVCVSESTQPEKSCWQAHMAQATALISHTHSHSLSNTQVDTEDYSNEVCTLQTAAQSFTKVDGQLVRLYLNSPVMLLPEKV